VKLSNKRRGVPVCWCFPSQFVGGSGLGRGSFTRRVRGSPPFLSVAFPSLLPLPRGALGAWLRRKRLRANPVVERPAARAPAAEPPALQGLGGLLDGCLRPARCACQLAMRKPGPLLMNMLPALFLSATMATGASSGGVPAGILARRRLTGTTRRLCGACREASPRVGPYPRFPGERPERSAARPQWEARRPGSGAQSGCT